jgi:hypothetical protein
VLPCFIELDFKDEKAFKSAGFGESIAPDTVKRIQLEKQLPPDDLTTEGLKGAATVITGMTIGLALATPFLSAGAG